MTSASYRKSQGQVIWTYRGAKSAQANSSGQTAARRDKQPDPVLYSVKLSTIQVPLLGGRMRVGIPDPNSKASRQLTSHVNRACSLDGPTKRADRPPTDLATSARPDRARLGASRGRSGSLEGIRSDPALSRQSDWCTSSDRPDRHGLGPEGWFSLMHLVTWGLLVLCRLRT